MFPASQAGVRLALSAQPHQPIGENAARGPFSVHGCRASDKLEGRRFPYPEPVEVDDGARVVAAAGPEADDPGGSAPLGRGAVAQPGDQRDSRLVSDTKRPYFLSPVV